MMVPMPSNSTISRNQASRRRRADQRGARRFIRGTRPTLDDADLPASCSIEGCCCVVSGVLIVIFSLASRYIFHDYTTVNSTFDKCTTFALDDGAPISYLLYSKADDLFTRKADAAVHPGTISIRKANLEALLHE